MQTRNLSLVSMLLAMQKLLFQVGETYVDRQHRDLEGILDLGQGSWVSVCALICTDSAIQLCNQL